MKLDDYDVSVIADSMGPSGKRLTTIAATYPRFVHAELMTHRQFSRNAASSRAIPVKKRISMVRDNPVMPLEWGRNQPGMQASELLKLEAIEEAEEAWLKARDACMIAAYGLDLLNVHKQLTNRVIECWSWITVLITSTEWSNFFGLRCDDAAQPEIQKPAYLIRDAFLPDDFEIDTPSPEFIRTCHLIQEAWERSRPQYLEADEWHLPFIQPEDCVTAYYLNYPLQAVSTARCARISYLTFEGTRDLIKDVELHDRLRNSRHWSPFEHVAQALPTREVSGNFIGFRQYRKTFAGECL